MIKEIITSIHPLSGNSLNELELLTEVECYQKGVTFIQKGRPNMKEYFLLDGICKSFLLNPEGEEVTLSFFNSKSVLSPHTTRTQDELSMLNFKSLTDISLAIIDSRKFEQMMVTHRDIRDFGNIVLRNELFNKVEKEIGMASLPAKERLIKLREEYPMLENLIPYSDIASYLGITNVSLSRLRRDLAR